MPRLGQAPREILCQRNHLSGITSGLIYARLKSNTNVSLKQVTINILTFFFWNVSQNIWTLQRLLFSIGILLNRFPLQCKSSYLLRLDGTHFSQPFLVEAQRAEDCKKVPENVRSSYFFIWFQQQMYLFKEQLILLLLILFIECSFQSAAGFSLF